MNNLNMNEPQYALLEVWQRGPIKDIPLLLQPVAHALLQAGEELNKLMIDFPDNLLWEKPAGVASPSFHLQHLSGVLDRVFTYARNEKLSPEQLIQLQEEDEIFIENLTVLKLINRFDSQINKAVMQLKNTDATLRLEAVRILAQSSKESTRAALLAMMEKDASGNDQEVDAAVRSEIKRTLAEIDSRLLTAEYIGRVFSGISLGSILLLAALGLAITYGLMGVINMAHGELLMIGAYTTYMVQVLFKSYWPEAFDLYLVVALPAAFMVSALVGIAMERSVIRYLYGRPLETLLATWGISLILIQTVRTIFGAQNVEVVNPAWMSGGFALVSNLVLPYNRIAIIVFSMMRTLKVMIQT